MKRYLFMTAAAVLSAVIFLASCKEAPPRSESPNVTNAPYPTVTVDPEECFKETCFLGDSNTAHLCHSGYTAIQGLVREDQVWTGGGNTLMLDLGMSVIDPVRKCTVKVSELAKKERPAHLIITLGYNGYSSFASLRKESVDRLFCRAYDVLIKDIKTASPKTDIIVQSLFPVTYGTQISDPEGLNLRIRELNGFLRNIANENGVKYLDTHSVLCDADGYLRAEYTSAGAFYHSDGYHLSDTGLLAVIEYIKENAYK